MGNNKAAVLESKKAHPLVIKDVDIPQPGNNEVIVEVRAIGINPVDWKIQRGGYFVDQFPAIIGSDAAGVVHSVGPGVSHVKVGQRVGAYGAALATKNNEMGAFQKYLKAFSNCVYKIPDQLSYEQAATIPLGAMTATHGLFGEDLLNLQLPGSSGKHDEIVLIYGGSSSVGQFAIQYASLAGYRVFATASPQSHDLVKSLGAEQAFDYRDSNVAEKIKTAGTVKHVYDAISEGGSVKVVSEVLQPHGGKVAATLPLEGVPKNIKVCAVFAPLVVLKCDKLKNWWASFIETSLANGSFKPNAVEKRTRGIQSIQPVLDEYADNGIRGKKFVVVDV